MAIAVQTVTTCELCGAQDVRQGDRENVPPLGWSEMVVRTRGEGAGWTTFERPFDGFICPACTGALRDWIDAAIAAVGVA